MRFPIFRKCYYSNTYQNTKTNKEEIDNTIALYVV